jgi:hypothetical protein
MLLGDSSLNIMIGLGILEDLLHCHRFETRTWTDVHFIRNICGFSTSTNPKLNHQLPPLTLTFSKQAKAKKLRVGQLSSGSSR